MDDFTNLTQAQTALADPATSAEQLMTIAQAQPTLWVNIAHHPNTYPGLLDWLSTHGDDSVKTAVTMRMSPVPAPPAPPTPFLPASTYSSVPVGPAPPPVPTTLPVPSSPASPTPQPRSRPAHLKAILISGASLIVVAAIVISLAVIRPWSSDTTSSMPNTYSAPDYITKPTLTKLTSIGVDWMLNESGVDGIAIATSQGCEVKGIDLGQDKVLWTTTLSDDWTCGLDIWSYDDHYTGPNYQGLIAMNWYTDTENFVGLTVIDVKSGKQVSSTTAHESNPDWFWKNRIGWGDSNLSDSNSCVLSVYDPTRLSGAPVWQTTLQKHALNDVYSYCDSTSTVAGQWVQVGTSLLSIDTGKPADVTLEATASIIDPNLAPYVIVAGKAIQINETTLTHPYSLVNISTGVTQELTPTYATDLTGASNFPVTTRPGIMGSFITMINYERTTDSTYTSSLTILGIPSGKQVATFEPSIYPEALTNSVMAFDVPSFYDFDCDARTDQLLRLIDTSSWQTIRDIPMPDCTRWGAYAGERMLYTWSEIPDTDGVGGVLTAYDTQTLRTSDTPAWSRTVPVTNARDILYDYFTPTRGNHFVFHCKDGWYVLLP